MLSKAAAELGIDLTRSWMIGDMISDILAGYHANCEGLVLVKTGKGLENREVSTQIKWHKVADLPAAAKLICQLDN